MNYLFGLVITLMLITSCASRNVITDVGDKYYIESHPDNPNIEVYRSSQNKRRFNGRVIRSATGLYDTTLHFVMTGTFKKGLLNGSDSIIRNNTLIRIENYQKGIKNGEQIELEDSIKTISPYKNGVIHGFQSIYVNDRIQKRSYFNQGIKDSVEYFYDSLGQVVTTFRYYFDTLRYRKEWDQRWDFGGHHFVSFSGDTLSIQTLNRSEYRGSIVFYSHDPKGIGDAWAPDVVHESITFNDFEEDFPKMPYRYSDLELDRPLIAYGYFYIINENTCSVCDYIDYEGIWIAYSNGFELEFYELRTY